MFFLFDVISILVSSAFFLLVANGFFRLKNKTELADEDQCHWPPVSVVVVTNDDAAILSQTLPQLMLLDYPDYEVIFVTERHDESAAVYIDKLLTQSMSARARHLVSGRTGSGSQKIHNLLAGVTQARSESEIFAFIDSTHIAADCWLKRLVKPIADGRCVATTGYHRIRFQNDTLANLGKAVTVLTLYMAQLCPLLTMMWGGNMAVRRTDYIELDISGHWQKNISEDTVLTQKLKQANRRFSFVSEAEVIDLEGLNPDLQETISGWFKWTARQWLNIKFIDRLGWWTGGGGFLLLLAVLLWSGFRVLSSMVSPPPPLELFLLAVPSLFFLVAFLILRLLHLGSAPLPLWLSSSVLAAFIGAFSHVYGWLTRWIEWGGRRYRIISGGEISDITILRTDKDCQSGQQMPEEKQS